ncbi:CBS domain-containing protein [Streptomyces sp. ISL-99]|uniref:CBS domain-containing protein n=1 Tax=Streptomyces sp. ISL-99 TaxID=2819193 RepID=UPI0027E439E4|nr:CBS domain-containing protein [Streptomyces sp. ISL-99]
MRIVAREGSTADYSVADACSEELVTVSPDDDLDRAVSLMREHAVRRLPVVENALPIDTDSAPPSSRQRSANTCAGSSPPPTSPPPAHV